MDRSFHFSLAVSIRSCGVEYRDDTGRVPIRFESDIELQGIASVDIADPVRLFVHLFANGAPPSCPDAADSDDDGTVAIDDGIVALTFLFLDGDPLPPPGTATCGAGPTGSDQFNECVDELGSCR